MCSKLIINKTNKDCGVKNTASLATYNLKRSALSAEVNEERYKNTVSRVEQETTEIKPIID
jgi:hypothetical protein